MNSDAYQTLINALEAKFDAIEAKLNLILNRLEGGCYLCGNRTLVCKLSDCPHRDTNFN